MALAVAFLVFLAVVTLLVGFWWAAEARRKVADRLREVRPLLPGEDARILRKDPRAAALLDRLPLYGRLGTLVEQAGRKEGAIDWVFVIGGFALAGGILGGLRGGPPMGIVAALVAGALPVLYLIYRRHRRLDRFARQFPDALDMMTRSIRAGYALSGAIQLVGEEMPDPVGPEFRQVAEEIRLGLDPDDALMGLQRRVPTEDTGFFCTALRIQRGAGGNLAEILDRLSEVIRERFKLLSHARVLSAQHRWSAIFVGLSPLVFGILFYVVNPKYYDEMFASPLFPYLLGAGLLFEAIGFFMIWRIAQIKV